MRIIFVKNHTKNNGGETILKLFSNCLKSYAVVVFF